MTKNQILSKRIERHVAHRLFQLGYVVEPQNHNSRYDLLLNDQVRIEIKGARAYQNAGRVRFQAFYHNQSDVVVFCPVINNEIYHFVLPSFWMKQTVNLAIWSHPEKYLGILSHWLERWDVIGDTLADLPRGKQLEMDLI